MSQCLQVNDSPHGPVLASHLTSVAAKDNFSSTVEVRVRQPYAQWRYRLDVLVDGRPTYFDRYPQKVQHFQGVTVYTPSNILNQSHVVIMFQSGAGVEVLENKGYMATRVYLPWSFIVSYNLFESPQSQIKIRDQGFGPDRLSIYGI